MLAMGGDHILYQAEIHAIMSWGLAIQQIKTGLFAVAPFGDPLPDRRAAKIFRAIIEDGRPIEFVEAGTGIESYGSPAARGTGRHQR